MAYCQTAEKLNHVDNLNYHKARCVLCQLISAGENNDGVVPMSLALDLGLVPYDRPGNAWIGSKPSKAVDVEGQMLIVG